MIYSRKKKYEVIRIPCLRGLSIPPIMRPGLSVVPPNCSATPPAVWSEAPWTLVTRPAVWSRASPSPDGNLKSCEPCPLPEAQAEDPIPRRNRLRYMPYWVHTTSKHLTWSQGAEGRRSVPGVCPATHIHSSFESNLGSGKTSRTSVLVFPNPWADPAQHTVHL
jgi:hypothetical protein